MPIYYATGSKRKALFWCFLSGITEPIGGILGFAALQPVMTDMVFGVIFGACASYATLSARSFTNPLCAIARNPPSPPRC